MPKDAAITHVPSPRGFQSLRGRNSQVKGLFQPLFEEVLQSFCELLPLPGEQGAAGYQQQVHICVDRVFLKCWPE